MMMALVVESIDPIVSAHVRAAKVAS